MKNSGFNNVKQVDLTVTIKKHGRGNKPVQYIFRDIKDSSITIETPINSVTGRPYALSPERFIIIKGKINVEQSKKIIGGIEK